MTINDHNRLIMSGQTVTLMQDCTIRQHVNHALILALKDYYDQYGAPSAEQIDRAHRAVRTQRTIRPVSA